MPIPDYQSIMLPLLKFIQDGKEYSSRDVIPNLELNFQLTEDEKRKLLPSGSQRVFQNRLAWAQAYLKMAGLTESTRRGYFRITKRGVDVLRSSPSKIDRTFLFQFPEFKLKIEESAKTKIVDVVNNEEQDIKETPDELIENGYQKIKTELITEILDRVKTCSPMFFEKLVVDLLVKMGYGGSKIEQSAVLGKAGDEGIDGIIKEDRLGLDVIYIQAKRWEGNVSRPEIQKFVGALQGQKAQKGVFITTSKFTNEAIDYASKVGTKIVLVSGNELAELMIDYSIGVSIKQQYEIKKIDSDYFIEE
jgi:restriction system protein